MTNRQKFLNGYMSFFGWCCEHKRQWNTKQYRAGAVMALTHFKAARKVADTLFGKAPLTNTVMDDYGAKELGR